jgi:hypothetical protein
MAEMHIFTIEVPGATLAEATTELPLLLIGSPMGTAGLATLGSHFTDRTVVTYGPRGASADVQPTSSEQWVGRPLSRTAPNASSRALQPRAPR